MSTPVGSPTQIPPFSSTVSFVLDFLLVPLPHFDEHKPLYVQGDQMQSIAKNKHEISLKRVHRQIKKTLNSELQYCSIELPGAVVVIGVVAVDVVVDDEVVVDVVVEELALVEIFVVAVVVLIDVTVVVISSNYIY